MINELYSNLFTYACDTPNYKRKGKPEAWVKVKDAPKKMFWSYPFFKTMPEEGKPEPTRYGDFVIDIDSGVTACQDSIKIIQWFEKIYSIEPEQWMVFLSGKKGVHLELSSVICGTGRGHRFLPLAYKRLAKDIEGELSVFLDTSMYNRGTGKPYRQPNIMRATGTCKRQVNYNDLYEITGDEEYISACSEPGELWPGSPLTESKDLALKLAYFLEEAEKEQKKIDLTEPLSSEESEALRKTEPPCVSFLRSVKMQGRSSATFNDIAMQLTGYAVTTGASEQQFISSCSQFIFSYPSSSLTDPEKRLSNCRDRFRCMVANGNQFDCGGMLSLGFSSWDFDCSKCTFKSVAKHVERVEVSEIDNMTLGLPEEIIDPGGLISECMEVMRSGGLPDIPQYNFPVVLATIARAISGKVTLEGYYPNLYMLKVGPTSSGKSSSDIFMQDRLKIIENFYGPSDFASGAALLRSLSGRPNSFVVLDEATKMFRRYGGFNQIADEKKDVLMELHTKTGQLYEKTYANQKDVISIDCPCISVTGNATPVIFDSIKEEDFETGLMQRFDFFCYDGKILNRGRKTNQSSDRVTELFNLLCSQKVGGETIIEQAMNTPQGLELTPGADRIVYDDWSQQITADANEVDEGGIRGIISRRFESSLKYALIHHASKNAQNGLCLPVDEDSIQWGIKLSKLLAEWKVYTMKGKVTTGEFHKDCELFKEAIRAALLAGKKRGKKPTFAFLANRRPALKNWERKRSEGVIEILSKRGEIVIDESGRATAYFLGQVAEF